MWTAFGMESEFNSHFSIVTDKDRSLFPQSNFDMSKLINFVHYKKDNNVFFSIPPITEVKVIDCLQNISSHKPSGIDNLSPRMLKLETPIIAPSIAKLINYSFNTISFSQRYMEDCKSISFIKRWGLRGLRQLSTNVCSACSFQSNWTACTWLTF